ncbi:DNA binding protein [Podila minutissima]|uniref:DNA binding protein n=1 Tax=Podila minutissima TaxID=64525 RepID=A0A9P5SPR7_9FUNG|nr:DNA binding protein [Podila minutissima]
MLQANRTRNTEVVSQEQSLAITKKVLRSSLGCIMYLRSMFPDEAFEDDNEHQVRIKRLVRGQHSEADLLLDWLEHGIFDALSRQYLRQLVVGISLDLGETKMVQQDSSNDKMVETYTFNFLYQGGHPSVQLEAPSENVSGSGQHSQAPTLQRVAQVQGSIAQMLRRLIVYTQTLEALTAEKFVNIRLYYWRDITPADYEPPGFGACRPGCDPFQIESPAAKISLGKVSTGYHSLDLHIQHMQEYPPQGNSMNTQESQIWVPESSPVIEEPVQKEHEELPVRKLYEQGGSKRVENFVKDTASSSFQPLVIVNPGAIAGQEPALSHTSTETDRLSIVYLGSSSPSLSKGNSSATSPAAHAPVPGPVQTRNKTLAEEPFDPTTDLEKGSSMLSIRPGTDILDCVCGAAGDEGDMFQCSECKLWGHLWCYGYTSCRDSRRPAKDLCYKCLLQKQVALGRLDQLKTFFANPLWTNLQNSCLLRRAIAILWQEGYSGCYKFSKRINIKITKARAMEKVLIDQEYLRNHTLANQPGAKPSSRARHDWRILKGDNARENVISIFDPDRLLDQFHSASGSRPEGHAPVERDAVSSQAGVERLSLDPPTLAVENTVPTQLLDSIPSQISDIRMFMPVLEETPVDMPSIEKTPEWVIRKVKASEPLPRGDDRHRHKRRK